MKKKVMYILAQIDRIGELAGEVFHLRNLYPDDKYEVTVITYPPHTKPRTNLSCYEIVMRGIQIAHTTNDDVICFAHKNWKRLGANAVQETENGIYVSLHPSALRTEFLLKIVQNGGPRFFFKLNESDLEKGRELRRRFGIPQEAQVVTLHVREAGYLPKLAYHSYRDAQIENFIPAVQYLVQQGYYVVRLGDTTMKRLPPISPQVVDAPFHEAYTDMVDPYFIATATFHMGSQAGPFSIARGFGVPILLVNNPILAADWGLRQNLFVPKKYFSRHLQRYLRYEEILSSFLDTHRSDDFERNGIELHDNTPQEILRAVMEMLLRLRAKYPLDKQTNRRYECIEELQRRAHEYRRRCQSEPPSYAMYGSQMQFSNEFLEMNPSFL
jgi:putative glycosyltransferase (TIGR04372 family)